MIDDRGTAVPTHQYIKLGNGVFILEPICCCHFAEPDIGCAIYCPLHVGPCKTLCKTSAVSNTPK